MLIDSKNDIITPSPTSVGLFILGMVLGWGEVTGDRVERCQEIGDIKETRQKARLYEISPIKIPCIDVETRLMARLHSKSHAHP
jgi:hypothetical protein